MGSDIKYIFGLTPMQEGMLFHKLITKDASSYHNQDALWIEEKIELEQFKQALKLLIFKHEAIGAAFVIPSSTGVPRQVFFNEREIECIYRETHRSDVETEIRKIKNEDLERGFDLQKECLMRVQIIYFPVKGKYYVLVSHHHIIMDGWCMNIVFGDLMRFYKMLAGGESYENVHDIVQKEKRTSSQYIEYLNWLKKANRKEGIEYWKKLLEGYQNVAEIIPLDREHDREERVSERKFLFGQDEYKIIKEAGRKANVTVNSVFEAAWGVLLQKYNYLEDVVFGKVVSGRNVPIHGMEETVGLFINTIPCRIRTALDLKVDELLKQVQSQAAMSTSYDFCPLVEIQKNTEQRDDLIKTLISFEYGNDYPELALEQESTREETNYDINLSFFLEYDKVIVRLIYNPGKYTETEMDRMLLYFKNLVLSMAGQPDCTIGKLSVLDNDKTNWLQNEQKTNIVAYPKDKSIIEVFAKQVEERPDETAVAFEEVKLTYSELNTRANQIARELQKNGVVANDRVVILSERSKDVVIGILGILKAGAAYVPVDISYPKERRNLVISDCTPKAVVTCGADLNFDLPTIQLEKFRYEDKAEEICIPAKQDDVVLIIYTSGTSGNPKGVMIEQHSVMNLVFTADYVKLGSSTRLLQTAQLAFDASTFEIWGTLLHGGVLHIVKENTLLNCEALKIYIRRHKISGFFITTALFNQFVMEDVEIFDTLEWVLYGGERASEKCTYLLKKHNPGLAIHNMYGPTEGTTFATCYPVTKMEGELFIGKAIPNVAAYVVNGESLCGIGMTGELCLSGESVARGYLHKKELTEQKFAQNTFGAGRIYKTGDLVRWNQEGNIQYLSRIDQQVKIRGFRVELGDIESAIRRLEQVRDVAVVAREQENEEKVLCAYIVLRDSLSAASINAKLSEELPPYMMPKHIAFLDSMPVTRNGKINEKELPEPQIQSKKEYVEPRNEVEQAVVAIFKEILGTERVSATDSFFELGGDSIKAIRVVSKMRAYSYEISVRDILKFHVVEEIAKKATESSQKNQYFQGEVTGEVKETPIIREFFRKNMKKPWHYNQSIMVSVQTEDTSVVCQVLDAITKHHDMLRAVNQNGILTICPSGVQKGYDFISVDLRADENYKERMEEECNQLQSSISLENGPLVKTALFHTVEGSFLFICLHHLVVDGVSWRILTDDLNTAFDLIIRGEKVELPVKTASFQEWSEALREYENSDILKAEIPYWRKTVDKDWPTFYEKTPPAGESQRAASIMKRLGKEATSQLMKGANKAYHTEVKDLLAAAFVMTLGDMFDYDTVVIGLEGHGREEIHKKIQIDRTVGWFTSIYPMLFEKMNTIEETIITVKDRLRGVPNNGLGYGILSKQLGEKEIPVILNYLGEMDAEEYENGGLSGYGTGINVAEENVFSALAVDVAITNGELCLELIYDVSKYQTKTVSQILLQYMRNLNQIISFCISRTESRRTRSDYTGNQILRSDLKEIDKHFKNAEIKDIYPLAPLQEGMLFHNIIDRTSTNYVIQTVFGLYYNVDAENMRTALQMMTMRYDVLRTVMLYTNISMPLQVVLNKREPEYHVMDLSDMASGEQEAMIEKLKEEDIARGFDLEEDTLVRCTLIKAGNQLYKILFTIHHIIVDGWSLSLIHCSLFQYYAMLESGTSKKKIQSLIEEERLQTGDYSEFIKWIGGIDREKAVMYWQQLLEGYEGIAEIQPIALPDKTESQMEKVEVSLDKTCVDKIRELSNELHVTANSIVEMVWGYVLCAYNYTDDVVFGKVVSGREAEIEGIEGMAGLFINTVPVRFSMKDKQQVFELIQMMQGQAEESRNYDYCPLVDIQRKLELGSSLIQTILIYQNFYVDYDKIEEGNKDGIVPEIESDREQLNYPISIIVSAQEEAISFSCLYNPNEFIEEEVRSLMLHVSYALKQVLDRSVQKAADILMVTEQERERILYEINDTKEDYQADQVAITLIEQRAANSPDDTALVFRDKKLTYKELNKAANTLAWRMKEYEIKPDDFVVLLTESSVEMMVAILAALKCGAAFVPVAPDFPQERINYIINDCKPKVILCMEVGYDDKNAEIPVLDLAEGWLWNDEEHPNPEVTAKPENIAYTLYTSGTTGRPKGVMVENHSIVNFMTVNSRSIMWEAYRAGYKKLVSVTNYTFDIFMTESLFALYNGYTIYLADKEEKISSEKFALLCEKSGIEVLQITPSRISAFISDPSTHRAFAGIKYIVLGGEKLVWNTIKLIEQVSDAQIYDAYGPTEATVYSSGYNAHYGEKYDTVSIGKPLANVQVYVVAKDKLCGMGVPGELCIAGDSLARGYLNNKDLTEEKFVPNLFGEGRMYRTGDLVKFREDGKLAYIDRIDDQIKIRGFRIELGEIESVLREIKDVRDTAVVVKNITEDDPVICAFLVSDVTLDIAFITGKLSEKLADYMIPQYIVQIPKIPVNTNGKLDKKALPFERVRQSGEYKAPESKRDIILCNAVQEVLGVEKPGMNDNFFQLGGDSLKAIRLISCLTEKGYQVSLQNVMRKADLGQLSRAVRFSSSSAEAMEVIRFFTNENLSDFAKSEKEAAVQDKQMQIYIQALQKEIDRYDARSCEVMEYSEYPLNGIQYMSYEMGVRYFAMQIPLCESVDVEKLSRSWLQMRNTYDVLGSSILFGQGKKNIRIYGESVELMIPYADLSSLDEYHKKLFVESLLSVMERFTDDSYYKEKHAAVIPVLVQFEKERYSIFLTGSHLVCDAFSFDIIEEKLLEYYYGTKFELEKYSYKDTLALIQNEFVTADAEEIEKELELEKFTSVLQSFEDNLSKERYEKGYFQMEENIQFEELSLERRLEIVRKLFVDALHHTFGELDIPVGMLHMARKTKHQAVFQHIGEFLDIVPIILRAGSESDIEQLALRKQMFMEEHNIFFAGMLAEGKMVLKNAARIPGAMLVYNNTGALAGTERVKHEAERGQSWNIFDCQAGNETTRFSILVKEGTMSEMTKFLNKKLAGYLETDPLRG